MADDTLAPPGVATGARLGVGLLLAMVSAVTFGLAGSFASSLFEAGWSAGAVAMLRIGIGAVVVLPWGIAALRGRWGAVWRNARLLVAYGLLAVGGAQFSYFSAVERMPVGPALLIEYTAPAAVVVWLWLRHGQRPGRLTLLGAAVAAVGLVLVLDLTGDVSLDPVGVAWSLGAMVGAATYFIVNADTDTGLPPLALAAGGLVVAEVALGAVALLGLLPLRSSTADVELAGVATAWWVPVLLLGVVTAGVAYVTGIAAGRRLGARLASFVALLEVVAAVLFAWLLLDQLPRTVQLLGGLLILAGVVAVKAGERDTATVD